MPRSIGRTLFASFFSIVLAASSHAGEPHTLYVSPSGDDTWSGKLADVNPEKTDGPFATLEHARDVLRALKKDNALSNGATVFVRGGMYALAKPLSFGPQDSGTTDAPIVYRAFENEKPILIGGKRIANFEPYKGEILKADVGVQGFKGIAFRQLFFNGTRQHLARYPNYDPNNPYGGGWTYADGKIVNIYQEIPLEDHHTVKLKPQDLRTWARPTELEVFVFPRYNWWNDICPVKSIDSAKHTITLAKNADYAVRAGDRFYIQNALEELDAPGEWYLDKETATLYFWPPSPIETKAVYAPIIRTILEIAPKTEHVIIRGLSFECCNGTAISLRGTVECQIAACTIRNVGDYNGSGVSVEGGRKNSVSGCDISEIGSHGIHIGGGDRVTLTPADNVADNNYIHHIGVFYKQGVGIELEGVGNRASHNLIHDGPRMGIMFSGNNLVLEYNHIRHMNLETEDTGAVYTGGRDWISSRGTVIRYNFLHDMLGYGRDDKGHWFSPHFAWGIYLDDNTGGVDVFGNIVARCSRAGIHLHNGRDNRIYNNVFVENAMQQLECNGWNVTHHMWKDHFPTMVKGYESVHGQPAWAAMRNMDLHPKDAPLPNGMIMTGNEFSRNIISYRDPKAKYAHFSTFPFDHNMCDNNLAWHFGRSLLTGEHQGGKEISDNLAPNPGFEDGEPNAMPKDWEWQSFPTPASSAKAIDETSASGKRCLRIESAYAKEKPQDNFPIIASKEFPLTPGHTYRLTAKFKATQSDSKAGLFLQAYADKLYFWANYPNDFSVGTEWKEQTFVIKIPGPGEQGYHKQMKDFRICFEFMNQKTGSSLFVDDVVLKELETLDEWASWQWRGMDRHTVVADPLFENPENDDYRLKAESPAFKLGFEAIPVDKIGLYKDELRASWPIVEAEGAREHPLK